MKTALLFSLIFCSSAVMAQAQNCFEGYPSTVDVNAALTVKKANLQDLKDRREEAFKKVDMNDNREVQKWSFVTGVKFDNENDILQNSIYFNSSCTREARRFFGCLGQLTDYQNAILNSREVYLTFDMDDPADQRKWQAVSPQLDARIDSAFDDLESCKASF